MDTISRGITSPALWDDFWNGTTGTYNLIYPSTQEYYQVENDSNELVVKILAAGVNKNDIKAYIEDVTLYVTSEQSDYQNINVVLNLGFYNVDIKKASVKLKDGVLTIKFPKKDKKIILEIK